MTLLTNMLEEIPPGGGEDAHIGMCLESQGNFVAAVLRQVELLSTSKGGKSLILRIAGARGRFWGLSAPSSAGR